MLWQNNGVKGKMKIINTSSSFTRPSDTTAYASGDLVANSTTAGSVTPMTFSIGYGTGLKVYRASVKFNSSTPTNAKFRLHLYSSSPTVTNGDNGTWLSTESGYLGAIDIDASALTFSDSTSAYGIYVNTALSIPMLIVSGVNATVYGLLAATAAYTPTSAEVFTVTLLGEAYV